jgi:SAM-dependent methyltransferase
VVELSHPERIVPDETEPGVVALHLKRYAFAEQWCRGKEVLDVACGAGYGSARLGAVAARVVGGDRDAEAIAYARRRYGRANVEFLVLDAASLPFEGAAFDAVCSFETIEHLEDREAYLREVARVLRQEGVYLVSTPRAATTTLRPENPHHFVEYSSGDFERLLRSHFETVDLYGQRRLQTRRHRVLQRLDVAGLRRRSALLRRASALTGTPATAEATLDDIVIEQTQIERASELVAVCTGPRP